MRILLVILSIAFITSCAYHPTERKLASVSEDIGSTVYFETDSAVLDEVDMYRKFYELPWFCIYAKIAGFLARACFGVETDYRLGR